MTKTQENAVNNLKALLYKHDFGNNPERREYKQLEVVENNGLTWVFSVVGFKNDDRSSIQHITRIKRKYLIGPRGGITAYINNGYDRREKTLRGWLKAFINEYDKSGTLFDVALHIRVHEMMRAIL